MQTVTINGTLRTDLGKKATRALRRAGNVPCNLYGGKESLNFYAPVSAFRKLIYTPEFRFAQIEVDGKTFKAIVKEAQFDSIKDDLLHLDFQELVDTVKVKVSVPLKLNGNPKGVATGGKLEQVIKKLTILALPKDLPHSIEVDVTDLELGGIKRISDIHLPGVSILLSASNPIARVIIPRAVKEEVVATPAAATATPAAAPKAEEKKK